MRRMFGSGFRRKITGLERAWQDASLERRREIASELHQLCCEQPGRDEALPLAERLLRHPDADVGEAATYAIHRCGQAGFLRLQQLLDDPSDLVRERACHALAHMKEDALPARLALLAALCDRAPGVRGRAAFALGQIADTSVPTVDALAAVASDPHSMPRQFALHALGRIGREGGARAVGAHRSLILKSLADADPEVRWSACYAIQTTDPGGTHLIAVLLDRLPLENEPRTRREMGATLGWAARGADLTPHLPRMIEIAHACPQARSIIFSLCSTLGARASALLPLLRESLNGDDAQAAISALRSISGDQAQVVSALESLLESGALHLRLWAGEELIKLRGVCTKVVAMLQRSLAQSPDETAGFITGVGPPLAALAAPLAQVMNERFDEPDFDLMWALTDAMASLQSTEPVAIEALRKALEHDSGIVKGSALKGLRTAGRAAAAALPDLRALLQGADVEYARALRDTIRAIEKPAN